MNMNEDIEKSALSEKVEGRETREPPMTTKEEVADFFRTALIAVFLAVLIRTFLYEPFNIPSGSMLPTLQVGDYLFVHKPSYGYSRHSFPFSFAPIEGRIWAEAPRRGDVVVFKLPTNPRIDYIKRIVALPGETVQVQNGRLYINGRIVPREYAGMRNPGKGNDSGAMREYIETLPGGVMHAIYEESDYEALDDTGIYHVPEGHYFVMGDNRDNSQDSRVTNLVGAVPFENLVGRADFIFFSTNGTANLFEVWKWPWTIRYGRFFESIDPVRLGEDHKSAEQ